MPDLHLGPLILRGTMLGFLLAAAAGYWVVRQRLRKSAVPAEPFLGTLANSLVLFLLIWKCSPVLREPSLIWTRPLGLLIYWGGPLDKMIGLAAAAVFMLYSLRKAQILARPAADLLSFGILAAIAVDQLFVWRYGQLTGLPWGIRLAGGALKYHPLNVYLLLLSSGLLAVLWQGHSGEQQAGETFRVFAVWFGSGYLLISLIAGVRPGTGLLAADQIEALLLVLGGLASPWLLPLIDRLPLRHNKRERS